jgi:hypothetical protein
MLGVLAVTGAITSCSREPDRRDPAARQVGREAYKASQEVKRGAKEAAQELRKAGKELRQGWNEAKRDEAPKPRK